jgi:hypothetical protein
MMCCNYNNQYGLDLWNKKRTFKSLFGKIDKNWQTIKGTLQ